MLETFKKKEEILNLKLLQDMDDLSGLEIAMRFYREFES